MIPPRTRLQLTYPTCTHVRTLRPQLRERNVEVLRVRDLVRDPLTAAEFLRRPYLRRSRYLATCREAQQLRQFYLGSSREYEAPAQLRIGLYVPGDSKPIDLIGDGVDFHPLAIRDLVRVVIRYHDADFGNLHFRVFATNLRLVS